jgi:vacuolar-type H+-ATPase subunit F/Vma7
MLKLYVIGPRAEILPFKSIGAELIDVQIEPVSEILKRLRQATEQILVMITEELTVNAGNEIAALKQNPNIIFLPIPSINTTPGTRMKEIQKMIALSLGVDLLGQKLAELSEKQPAAGTS